MVWLSYLKLVAVAPKTSVIVYYVFVMRKELEVSEKKNLVGNNTPNYSNVGESFDSNYCCLSVVNAKAVQHLMKHSRCRLVLAGLVGLRGRIVLLHVVDLLDLALERVFLHPVKVVVMEKVR